MPANRRNPGVHHTARQSRDREGALADSGAGMRSPAQRVPRRGSDWGFMAVHFYVAHPIVQYTMILKNVLGFAPQFPRDSRFREKYVAPAHRAQRIRLPTFQVDAVRPDSHSAKGA